MAPSHLFICPRLGNDFSSHHGWLKRVYVQFFLWPRRADADLVVGLGMGDEFSRWKLCSPSPSGESP